MPENKQKRVRVDVTYGDSYQGGKLYTYLVRPEQAQVGQQVTVPVNNGGHIYNTTATVVRTTSKSSQIKRPRRSV